jgi:DNA (cytosine-5)-methyltransferase 1
VGLPQARKAHPAVSKPRLLDVFCGAGGAAMGYHRAGFDVVGVDINPQPNYPFEFAQMDALEVLKRIVLHGAFTPAVPVCQEFGDFAAIHASPPCQAYSTVTQRNRHRQTYDHPELIAPTRELLRATGLPYVIENVEGASRELLEPTRICGSAFRDDLHRHRYFETNWPLMAPPCAHGRRRRVFRSLDSRMVRRGQLAGVVGVHGHLNYPGEKELREAAMEIDWMATEELTQAIPPMYTELIGHQLAQHLKAKP